MTTLRRVAASGALAILFLLALSAPASAHASRNTDDGKFRVTWGWQNEPMYLGEKLQLDLVIREISVPGTNTTGAGVGGLTSADVTELKLVYGDEEYDWGNITAFRGAKSGAFAGDGNYTGANRVWPTTEGIYSLKIKGSIRGTPVDLVIPAAHELHGPEDIAFPGELQHEGGADIAALEARLDALEAKLAAQSKTPSPVTKQEPGKPVPGLGLVGVLAAGLLVVALRRRA